MNMTDHLPRPRAHRSIFFIALAGLLALPSPAAAEDAASPAPAPSSSSSPSPPKEPAPEASAAPSAPSSASSSSPSSSSSFPAAPPAVSVRLPPSGLPFIGIAAGFVVLGGAILIGTSIIQDTSLTNSGYLWPNARVYGCHLPAVGCDQIFDALDTVQTAADVQMITLLVMGIGGTTFLSTGLLLELSRDVRVQAAPAVGEVTGLTVRGTF